MTSTAGRPGRPATSGPILQRRTGRSGDGAGSSSAHTPLFANSGAADGFSFDNAYHWEVYDFTSLRLGELIHVMSPEAPRGKLHRVPPYESVWTTLHGLAWSDMSFFSRPDRRGAYWPMYPRRTIPLWMPASVLTLALLPNALALIGMLTTVTRRKVWPLHFVSAATMAAYFHWVLSQTEWALKTKYILFLLPAYLVYLAFGLRWVERAAPSWLVKGLWGALALLVLLTHIYMFRFSIGG